MPANEVLKALFDIQKIIENPKNSKENTYHHNNYVPLSDVLNYIKPILTERGILLQQDTGRDEDDSIFVQTTLTHMESGDEFKTSKLPLKPDSQRVQQVGSAITYGRRYQLMILFGIVGEDDDDDGNSADNLKKGDKKGSKTGGKQGSKPANGGFKLESVDDPELRELIKDLIEALKDNGYSDNDIGAVEIRGEAIRQRKADNITKEQRQKIFDYFKGK